MLLKRSETSSRPNMTAADALLAAGIDLHAVRATLPTVEPHAVWIVPASRFARRFWAKGIGAVSMPWGIYVTPAIFDRLTLASSRHTDGVLVVHELVHLHQYRSRGAVRHGGRYVLDYLRGRKNRLGHWDSYLGIGAEVEARTIADGFAGHGGPR